MELSLRSRASWLAAAIALASCSDPAAPADATVASDAASDVVPSDIAPPSDRPAPDDAATVDRPSIDAPSTDTPAADAPSDAPSVDVGFSDDVSPEGCTMMGGGLCFVRPPGVVQTNRGPLDFSCAETPAAVTAGPSTVHLGVVDFTSGEPVDDARVALSADANFTAVTTATSGDGGTWSLTAPAGTPSRAFWRVQHADYLDTYSFAARLDVRLGVNQQRLYVIPPLFVPFVYTAVGAGTQAPRTGILGSVIDDCDGHALENVVVTLSSTSSVVVGNRDTYRPPTFVPGAKVFYFDGDASPRPVPRSRRIATGTNGVAVILDVPETVGDTRWFMQAWGYRTPGVLRLMGETPVRSIAGAIVLPEVQAFR